MITGQMMAQVLRWIVLVCLALLPYTSGQGNIQEVVCPSQCSCRDKRDSPGGLYRVECIDVNVQSLSELEIPTATTQLSIIGNPGLTRIGRDDLSLLVNLDKLNLSGNAIRSVENGAFISLQSLTKLDLSANQLSSINNSMFLGLGQLKRLFLTNNLVQRIERGGFSFLTNVNRVSLSGNLFSTLADDLFSPMTQLERIDFDSENLICDCTMKWIVKWMEDTDVNIPDTKCAGPATLHDVPVRNLNRDNLKCDWPVDVRLFELRPSTNQLVFAGDKMPIDCRVSNDDIRSRYWYRQGQRVTSNITAKISVTETISDQGIITLSLMIDQITTDSTGTWSCVVETAQGDVTKSINIVVNQAFCPKITVDSGKGKYTWERAGFNSRSEQQCKSGDSGAKAFYTCDSKGEWTNLDVKACKYSNQITQVLQQLSMDDFNSTTNLNMVDKLMETTSLISDKMDVVFVARILKKISSSYDLYSKAEIPNMVYNITSLMMNVNSTLLREAERMERSCTSMIENLETVVSFVLQERTAFNIYVDNIALEARKYSKEMFKGLTCTAHQNRKLKKTYLANNFICVEQSNSPDLVNSDDQKVDAMIHIPAEVRKSVSPGRLFKLVVIIFRNDQLFQTVDTHDATSAFFVPSSVLSASIIGTEVKDLSSSVMVALPRFDFVNRATLPNVKAVYWQEAESKWATSGCRISNTVEQTSHNLSVMECEHMTSYALLQERTIPQPLQQDTEIFTVMNAQTYIGASFLCLCLMIIILTYTCSYKYINLSKKLKHSLVNTCISIFLLEVIFVLGVQINHQTACKVIGMAIHYFSITTIFWMTVTSWNIYRKISGKVHHHTPPLQNEDGTAPLQPHPMLKFYLFAWGIPVVICGITGAVDINFYSNSEYCFVAWTPGLYAFYGVVGLFIMINSILYLCICSTKRDHVKAYMDEMMVLNAEGCLEPQHADDVLSQNGSIKSSIADTEYKPVAQLTGIILFLMLYLLMWTSGAFSIALQSQTDMEKMDVILSSLYMILCIILGIFLLVFYCLARNDTRKTWSCRKPEDYYQPPRSNTNINVITHANAHHSLKREEDSCSGSMKDDANQSNPLLQIMQYHKQNSMMTHSVAGSHSRGGDPSIQGVSDDVSAFYNPRQNGVAKRYWEKKRTSRDRGLNHSMLSVPETGRLKTHSPTNTEPAQHMSIEIQIKSHSSKQARRHRLGSTNSEPADVRNNIYHSMPKSPHRLDVAYRQREPTIGQSKTSSECGTDITPQFYQYPPDMWQSSVPRNFNHMIPKPAGHQPGYIRQSPMPYDQPDSYHRPSHEALHKQSYVHNYIRSMRDADNSDDESRHSHRSRRSSNRSRHRHRHRHETDSRQLSASALNESHMSLMSHTTAKSAHSNRSGRSSHRHRHNRVAEERPLLHIPAAPQHAAEDEEKLNINHSSSDNNSSHYACAPIQDAANKKIINNRDSPASAASPSQAAIHLSHANIPTVQVQDQIVNLSAHELTIPEERIYENARKVMQHERPVYTNLEELRQQAAAKLKAQSPEPEYELPVYENLFSLNEYDTLKKNKHHVNKGLPLGSGNNSIRDLRSPAGSQSKRSDARSPLGEISGLVKDSIVNDDSSL